MFPFSFKFPDRSEFFVLSPCISKEPFCPFTSFLLIDRFISTSFKFDHGRVVHELRVQLKRPLTRTRWITTAINFVSKPNVNIPRLMVRSCRLNLPLNKRRLCHCHLGLFLQEPQDVTQLKTFRFGSGSVRMNVYLEHKAYKQGNKVSRWKQS